MSTADLVEVLLEDTAWHQHAACRPRPGRDVHDLFMPGSCSRRLSRKERLRFEQALEICAACTVRPACAQAAAAMDYSVGVWGGQIHGQQQQTSPAWRPARRMS